MADYRPISIIPTGSKVIEKYISEQIIQHLDSLNCASCPLQFGFRKNHSTETANNMLLENVKAKSDREGVVGAIYLDFKKAFDTVRHDILINKLSKYNFSPTAIQWLKSYLENRKQCVRVCSSTSCTVNTCMGVPQGSTLGPLLFTVFINDLPDACQPATCQMFADDSVIYLHATTKKQAAKELPAIMISVRRWLKDSCLFLNLQKTVCMYFTKKSNKEPDPPVEVAGCTLTVVQEHKY